ncbi:MAG TPA: hypothetical protein VGK20_17660 [Candidatus Binatia bacterium]|jgi:hypothetical protein
MLTDKFRGIRLSSWSPALLAAAVLLAASNAGAMPRGKVLPRQIDPAGRSAQPSGDANVGRPDSSCRPHRNTLVYHGGELVQHPDVFLLFWGSLWNTDAAHISAKADLESMYGKLVTSEFACAWQEYGVPAFPLGTGSYAGSFVISGTPPNPILDSDIQTAIQAEIAAHHAPAIGSNEVYVMVTPDGFPVTASDGSTGCGGSNFQFCGYHDEFQMGPDHYRYEVLPFPCSDGGGTCFVDFGESVNKAYEVVGSHELSELVTDPDNAVAGWYSDHDGQENADICAADSCIFDLNTGMGTFSMNSTWSNLARGCVASVPCAPRSIGCTDDAPGACSASAGKTGACSLEWQVDPNLSQKKGETTGRVTCSDGLPFCDADGMSNGTCTFHVAACMNNSDPRIATCQLSPIDSITIRQPLVGDPLIATILDGLNSADPSAVGSVSGNTLTFSTPASTGDSCTSYLDVPVAAGERLTISARLTTDVGHVSSKLQLTCTN